MKPAHPARAVVALLLVLTAACASGDNAPEVGEASSVRARDVRFETSDGLELSGRLFGSGRVGVTLAHMFPADARSWYPAAEKIAEAGYLVLAFNFRGYATSEGDRSTARAPRDLEAARDFLVEQGAQELTLVGASMGGTASLVAADALDPLAVVCISAPRRFMGLDAEAIATRLQRPVLLIASRDDGEALSNLERLARSLPNPDTKIFEGSAHGTDLLDARPEAVDVIIEYLERYAPVTLPQPTEMG